MALQHKGNSMDRRRFLKTSVAAAVAASLPARAAFEDVLHRPTEVGADVEAITGGGKEVLLSQAEVQELSNSLKGRLLLPGSPAYDEARMLINPVRE
jgi:secreted PhoX family phosphatase